MSGTASHYTQAFSPLPDRCLCLVSGGEGGGPTPLPGAARLAGLLPRAHGRRFRVGVREGHRPR